MLSSLFGDDEEETYFPCNSETDDFPGKRNGNTFSVSPPRPRLECNMAGIENQGATCYLNSLLQTLLFTPEFRESLFRIPKEELGCLEDKDKPGSKVRVIPLELQRLFVSLLLCDKQCVSTRKLTDSFGWTGDEQLQQHDVQELSRILFSAINDSLAGTSGSNLISDLYHGSIVSQIICSECETCSGREEDFLDLTLTINGNNGLESALSRYYQETELLDGKNQYHCGKCQKLVDAKKGARLKKLPPILTISLLRFSYDFNKMERYKECGKFAFPLELDMAPYMDKPGDDEMYELFSVVIHQGSAYGGHYHAYIRDIDDIGNWYSPDEEKIHLEPTKENTKQEVQKLDTPLELLEAILLDCEDHSISVDKLGTVILNRTKKSWKASFGKYGQMSKFIKKHDDVFKFNQSKNTIQLKKGYTICNKISDRPIETSQPSPSATTDLPNDSPTTNGLPEPGNCWFDYNDSRVSPISVNSLETQFQGKESAYMLFYRRKDLKRPEHAIKNRSYCIDEELVLETLKENDEIHQQRLEYEEAVNRITVQLYFACNYTITNNIIKPETASPEYTVLTIDKRTTISLLLANIHEVGNELVPREPVINRLKDLPTGIFIQENLSDDVDKALEEVGIKDQEKLFVWDGQQMNTGEIYLTVNLGNSIHAGWFPKNMTLKLLIEQVCSVLNISKKENITVKILTRDNNQSVILNIIETLETLKLCDGDSVIIEDKEREEVEENGRNTPETETISNLLQSSSEPTAVSHSMIKLFFTPGDDNSTIEENSITIDNSVTIGECLTMILLQSNRTGDEWHLRKTNWCREAEKVLDDGTVSLLSAGIKDGDYLLIEPGKLPPKGFLVLSIWLIPNLPTSSLSTDANPGIVSSCKSFVSSKLQEIVQSIVGSNENKEKTFMGEIVISKESTLEELKFQILTLPQVVELEIPSIEFLRVRKLTNCRPTTILRDVTHALKRHKVKTPEDLAIQVLPQIEQLNTSKIILEVKVRQPETSTYSPSVEVLWDTSKGSGIASLKQAIASALKLPVDQILLAKYFYERYEWKIIKEKDNVQQKGKKNKKKHKIEKVNLRQTPYFIADGDIIGVKNLEIDQNKTDFETQEDIEGKQRLQKLAEDKKKRKEEDIIERETTVEYKTVRRPEVALTIKVDKFT